MTISFASRRFLLLAALSSAAVAAIAPAAEPAASSNWLKLPNAEIVGRRWDVPLAYAPKQKRFIVLGGRMNWADYKQPRSYDVLLLDLAHEKPGMPVAEAARWENAFPTGKNWGPQFGACRAPAWKDERFDFRDMEQNIRPNWTVYGTFSLGQKYAYDAATRQFYFYAGGRTFRYEPAGRTWEELKPANHPEKELGGILLWSSLCHETHRGRLVLFGGGNVQSPRGDPGTWTYEPSGNVWTQLHPNQEPPARANSRLAYDPVAKKIILFGGDRLDQLLADTWIFDVTTGEWEERQPPVSPTPRGGHALLWLPKARKILLLGGYGYTSATGYVESLYQRLPLEAWTYDVADNRWELIKRFEQGAPDEHASKDKAKARTAPPEGPTNFFLSAAVDEDDTVLALANGTWLCRLDASHGDAPGTAKYGVRPGTVTRRTGPHDPAWYRDGVAPADPAKVRAVLADTPANRWVQRLTPKLPRPNMDWGSAVFAPDLDLILRFSGGHSAYSGTAPQIYDVKTDRYSIPFTPEYPLEYVYSNDQVHGEWSFQGNPWMTGHTYKSTGYDPNLKCLVFAPHEHTYFFDPPSGKWSRGSERNPYRADFYVVTLCATPQGAVAWADKWAGGAGLWRLDAATRQWRLPLRGELPDKSPDRHGVAFDTRRERLLLFSDLGKHAGDVAAYDLKTGEAKWLAPAGGKRAAVHSRETIYLPGEDAVLIAAHVRGADGKPRWPLYDCAKNAWQAIELAGADPVGKGDFNNSLGLMYDAQRKLIWAVGQNSHVHTLRLDMKTADRVPLADQ